MKALITLFLLVSMSIFYMSYNVNINKKQDTSKKDGTHRITDSEIVKDSIADLITAIIYVESRGDTLAINRKSNAVGCMQIRPIMVKDVNRILLKSDSEITYSLRDRYSKVKSIEMFNIWRCYYHNKSSLEKISRCWNGGTKGHLRSYTLRYWTKVKEFYESNK